MSLARRFTVLVALLVGALTLIPTAAQAERRPIVFGQTELTLSPQAAAALPALGVAPSLIAPASATDAGAFAFPIRNGLPEILATGQIRHRGGVVLTAGPTRLELTDFTVGLLPRPTLTATVNGGDRITLLDLDFRGAGIVKRPGIALGPVQGRLTQQAADALNATFGVIAFAKGFPLGAATVVLQLPRQL